MKISLKSEGEAYARQSIFVRESGVRNLTGFRTVLFTGSTNQNRRKPYDFMMRTVSYPLVNNPWFHIEKKGNIFLESQKGQYSLLQLRHLYIDHLTKK